MIACKYLLDELYENNTINSSCDRLNYLFEYSNSAENPHKESELIATSFSVLYNVVKIFVTALWIFIKNIYTNLIFS